MNHLVPDELISAYFDGEVTPDERSEVERLLESSPEFRQQLDETSKLSGLLHSFPREAAAPELAVAVQKRIQDVVIARPKTSGGGERSLRREWSAFGVGILATMASLLMFVRFNRPQMPQGFPEPMAASTPAKMPGVPDEADKISVAARSEQFDFQPPRAEENLAERESIGQTTDAPAASTTLPAATIPSTAPLTDAPSMNLPLLAANSVETNPNLLQSQIQKEYLISLTNGEVIVPMVADPSNTIAVVDFIVVDIVRDTLDLKVLLQRRSVTQLDENNESLLARKDGLKESVDSTKSESKKSPRADELQVFFVSAPGDQLASTIDEFTRNHPDLQWVPQLPIELPQLATKQVEDAPARRSASGKVNTEPSSVESAVEESKVVAAEADLAFGALMARNGVAANPDRDAAADLADPAHEIKVKSDSRAMQNRMLNSTFQRPVSSNPTPIGNSNERAYFVQNQAQLGLQLAPQGQVQNSAVPLLAQQSANGQGPAGGMRSRYAGGNNEYRNNENRNSRPVKMLMVLKSQSSASNPAP